MGSLGLGSKPPNKPFLIINECLRYFITVTEEIDTGSEFPGTDHNQIGITRSPGNGVEAGFLCKEISSS